jgi:GNAT superfamily N-acetyltransferase
MLTFRKMKKSDVRFFMNLMEIVGWGMTLRDFEIILCFSPEGCFITEQDGKKVGMVVTTNYGDVAWIGNLVVMPKYRGKGIGAELMSYAMDYLKSCGVKTIKLDGVQSAIPLYRRLGFTDEYWSLRYVGIAMPQMENLSKQMKSSDLEEIAALDLKVFKAPRPKILEYVYELYPDLCFTHWVEGKLIGFIMAKEGKNQLKIGPWIVKQGYQTEAEQLLHSLMNQRVGDEMWVGVPEGNIQCIEILLKNEFTSLPSSLRMCYGDCGTVEEVNSVYGLGGPDKG